MKRAAVILFLTFLMTLTFPTSAEGAFDVRLSEPVDLTLHVLAHMNTGTAADNYDAAYIAQLQSQRPTGEVEVLLGRLEAFAPAFRQDMSLWLLSVLPIYYESVDSFLAGLGFLGTSQPEYLQDLTLVERNVSQGVQPMLARHDKLVQGFRELLLEEHQRFYAAYWLEAQPRLRAQKDAFTTFLTEEGYPAVQDAFEAAGLDKVIIYLSEGMRRNGRGFSYLQPTHVGAIVPLQGEVLPSYFTAVHEITHAITDPLVAGVMGVDPNRRSLDPHHPGYQTHLLIEKAVIIANYWMFASRGRDWTEAYLEHFVGRVAGVIVHSESEFLSAFRVPEPLAGLLREWFFR